MSQILIHVGDYKSAISTLYKTLAISVQLYGLDSTETFNNHLRIATIYQKLQNYSAAMSHYMAAKYIIWLIGGTENSEMSNIYFCIGGLYSEMNNFGMSLKCLLIARDIIVNCGNQAMNAFICQSIGDVHSKLNNYKDSIAMYKQSYIIHRHLFGDSDSRTIESKSHCENSIRSSAENEMLLKEKLELEEKEEKARKMTMWLDEELGGSGKGKKSSGSGKGKKGKGKK
jgi:tetratricopeptide (TPR) repeat protein